MSLQGAQCGTADLSTARLRRFGRDDGFLSVSSGMMITDAL
jgi:hypothetical protein